MDNEKKIPRRIMVFFLLFFGFTAVPGSSLKAQTLRIAAAANLQYLIRDLATEFGKQGGFVPELVIGSSGSLAAQISQGVVFDIFISADTNYPLELYKKGFAADKPVVCAFGSLVLWTGHADMDLSAGTEVLLTEKIARIAIADTIVSPYGAATIEFLRTLGIYEQVREKIVYAQSISEVNQFVVTGGADIGFTAKSIVVADDMAGKGAWVPLDSTLYSPIPQSAVLLTYGRDHHSAAAGAFYRFLYSQPARALFLKYGYLLP